MKFSITIPTYRAQYLREAIESVVSQTCPDWELIIVDDCSPENLHAIVKPFLADSRISYYRNERNCGAANVVDNWNICLGHCTGDYVVCMGDDDRLLPCCLEEYLKLIAQYPDLNVYHARTRIIDEAGNAVETLAALPPYETCQEMLRGQWKDRRKQFIGDFLFSRQWLVAKGGYVNFPLAYCSDWATANLAAKEKGIANGGQVMFEYRSHNQTISRSQNLRLTVTACDEAFRWYEHNFEGLLPDVFRHYFASSIKRLVIMDVTGRPLCEMPYWLFRAPKTFISRSEMANACLRGVAAKILKP